MASANSSGTLSTSAYGCARPSAADKVLTDTLKQALASGVLGHLIVAGAQTLSIAKHRCL